MTVVAIRNNRVGNLPLNSKGGLELKLETLESKIKTILEENETARADDMALYANYVYKELGAKELEVLTAGTWLVKIFSDRRFRILHGISGTESVRRCRQKLQEKYPELRPSAEVIKKRKEEEKRYKAYARGENENIY